MAIDFSALQRLVNKDEQPRKPVNTSALSRFQTQTTTPKTKRPIGELMSEKPPVQLPEQEEEKSFFTKARELLLPAKREIYDRLSQEARQTLMPTPELRKEIANQQGAFSIALPNQTFQEWLDAPALDVPDVAGMVKRVTGPLLRKLAKESSEQIIEEEVKKLVPTLTQDNIRTLTQKIAQEQSPARVDELIQKTVVAQDVVQREAAQAVASRQAADAPLEQGEELSDLLRRDQMSLRPTAATGNMTGRNLADEMRQNITRYSAKIPDVEIRRIREESLLDPETIDEILLRKRGIISDAEAITRATKIRGSIDDVLKLPKGTVASKEQYTAVEQIIQNEREINKRLRNAVDEGITTGGSEERALIRQNYPEMADKSDTELLELALQESTTKLKKAEIALMGLRSEAGRSLQATKQFVEGVDQRLRVLYDQVNRSKKLDEPERIAIIDTIAQLDTSNPKEFLKQLERLSNADFFDKFAEWSVAAKLWNPTTHAVNLGGNAVRQLLDLGIKTFTNPITAKADMAGAAHGLKMGLRNAVKTLTSEGYAQQLSKYIELGGRGPAIKGKTGAFVRTPFRMLSAGDEIFRNMAYQRKLYREAAKIARKEGLRGDALEQRMTELLNRPTFDMMDKATEEAKRMTFQEDMGDIVSRINQLRDPSQYKSTPGKSFGVLTRTFLPFLKTPTNLFKQSIDLSPLGLLKNFGELKKAAKAGDKERVGTIVGEALVGSAVIAFISEQVAEGNITGGAPSNPADKDRFYRENKLPYAMKIDDTWYQYQRLDPLALIIGMTADMQKADEKTLSALVGAATENLKDKTYLSGVSDLMKVLTGEEWERDYALKSAILGSAFPSFIGHTARSMDPVIRDVDSIGQRLIAQTPGLSEELPGRVNVLGYSIERANQGLSYFFNPIQKKEAGIDPVTEELMSIDKSISLPNAKFKRDKVSYELSPREYEDFARFTGIKLRHELEDMFDSPKYKRADDEERGRMIDRLRSDIMNEWKDAYVEEQESGVSRAQQIRNIMAGRPASEPERADQIRSYFFGE